MPNITKTYDSKMNSTATKAVLTATDSARTRKMNFYQIIFIYMLGGIVGTLWETLLNYINGNGFVYCNGSIFTPFNFVYGCGAVIIIACLHNQTAEQPFLI